MTTDTHYTTLCLVPSAPPEVIRASYKALVLTYHPDKTVQLAARERATHAAAFKEIQAAYDVLGNASLKAMYDARLSRRNNKADQSTSTRTPTTSTGTTQRKPSVKLTTPLEKAAVRAKARQSLEYLRVKRAEREDGDAHMDIVELKAMVEIWSGLAEENKSDPAMHAHCTIREFEYNQKIAERKQQHRDWLARMSSAKRASPTTASSSTASTRSSRTVRTSSTTPTAPDASPTPVSHTLSRAEERKRAEAERVDAAAARAQARALEKAQRETAKQARLDQKVAAVRAEKEKLQLRIELQDQADAARIAKARARVHTTTSGLRATSVQIESSIASDVDASAAVGNARGEVQSSSTRLCTKCGDAHANIREWSKCNNAAGPSNA